MAKLGPHNVVFMKDLQLDFGDLDCLGAADFGIGKKSEVGAKVVAKKNEQVKVVDLSKSSSRGGGLW